MTYGFLTTNDNNQVLVSSDSTNLHFIAKYSTPTNIVKSDTNFGGINILNYRVSCSKTPVTFFTMPNKNDYYAVGRIVQVQGSTILWDIEVIKSGPATGYPELYIFAEPSAATPTDTYGLLVYKNDGVTPAFDSRLRPLVVTDTFNITLPNQARSYLTDPGLNYDACGSNGTTAHSNACAPLDLTSYLLNHDLPYKPIYFYSSLAQTEYEIPYYAWESKYYAFGAYTEYREWWSNYWAFYRAAIKAPAKQYNPALGVYQQYIYAGWITINYNCYWDYKLSRGLFGSDYGGRTDNGGKSPYTNETINTIPAPIIIADAYIYDL